jgi:hypothetical protein
MREMGIWTRFLRRENFGIRICRPLAENANLGGAAGKTGIYFGADISARIAERKWSGHQEGASSQLEEKI